MCDPAGKCCEAGARIGGPGVRRQSPGGARRGGAAASAHRHGRGAGGVHPLARRAGGRHPWTSTRGERSPLSCHPMPFPLATCHASRPRSGAGIWNDPMEAIARQGAPTANADAPGRRRAPRGTRSASRGAQQLKHRAADGGFEPAETHQGEGIPACGAEPLPPALRPDALARAVPHPSYHRHRASDAEHCFVSFFARLVTTGRFSVTNSPTVMLNSAWGK